MKRLLVCARLLTVAALFALLHFGCRNVDCMAPPSEIAIQIADGDRVYPADLDTASRVRVFYVINNQPNYLADLQRMDDVFSSRMLIETSRSAGDPEFTFELNGRTLARMKLDTYINNARCNGWAAISEVYQNGEAIHRAPNGAYLVQ